MLTCYPFKWSSKEILVWYPSYCLLLKSIDYLPLCFEVDPHYLCCILKKNYFIFPLVFLDVCFVHNVPKVPNKLSTCSTKWVFICYSQTQKEYRCFNLETCKFAIGTMLHFLNRLLFFQGLPHTLKYTLHVHPFVNSCRVYFLLISYVF